MASLVGAVIAAIVLIGVANCLRGDDNNTSNVPVVVPTPIAPVDGMTLGNADAPITVYEYSDFQCPNCRNAAVQIVPPLDENYFATGKANLIFKNFAFIGQESKSAAEAAVCASDQGKFWQYYAKLFEEQNGENKGAFKVANLKLFAEQIGLNQADFNTCLDEHKHAADIADDLSEGQRRGVGGTPTFFVGQTEVGATYDAISKAIDDELVRLGLATPEPTATPPPTQTPQLTGTPTPEGTPSG